MQVRYAIRFHQEDYSTRARYLIMHTNVLVSLARKGPHFPPPALSLMTHLSSILLENRLMAYQVHSMSLHKRSDQHNAIPAYTLLLRSLTCGPPRPEHNLHLRRPRSHHRKRSQRSLQPTHLLPRNCRSLHRAHRSLQPPHQCNHHSQPRCLSRC